MAEKPWIKWFTSDFLNGIADLEADEIGIYAVILNLIADRGAPIADDPAWLARRAGTSTRRFNKVRERLIELGKLEVRNGLIGNRRMIAEVEKRDGKSQQARAAAIARWHGHNEPELPLGDEDAQEPAPDAKQQKNGRKTASLSGDNRDLNSPKNTNKSLKSAVSDDADAFFPSRARARQMPEIRNTQSNESSPPPRAPAREAPADPDPDPPKHSPLDNRDLMALMNACSEASGYFPIQPGAIAKAMDTIRAWRDAGIDFEEIVIPTIKHVIANSPDPTSSFARFDRKVRHEQARKGAQPKTNGSAYKPPASPILDVEGEEPVMRQIRVELLDRLGPSIYCLFANKVRFERVEMGEGDKRVPIRVIEPSGFSASRLMDGERASLMRLIAKSHGFTDVW